MGWRGVGGGPKEKMEAKCKSSRIYRGVVRATCHYAAAVVVLLALFCFPPSVSRVITHERDKPRSQS